jgi:hypothetical protein
MSAEGENKMKSLVSLCLLSGLVTGCSSHGYKRHNMAVVKYTVREYYLPSEAVKTVKPIINHKRPIKPKKAVKKAKKVDCQRVFSLANSCMVK